MPFARLAALVERIVRPPTDSKVVHSGAAGNLLQTRQSSRELARSSSRARARASSGDAPSATYSAANFSTRICAPTSRLPSRPLSCLAAVLKRLFLTTTTNLVSSPMGHPVRIIALGYHGKTLPAGFIEQIINPPANKVVPLRRGVVRERCDGRQPCTGISRPPARRRGLDLDPLVVFLGATDPATDRQ
jgi:hypothetical protein